jgi:hypothetical protein
MLLMGPLPYRALHNYDDKDVAGGKATPVPEAGKDPAEPGPQAAAAAVPDTAPREEIPSEVAPAAVARCARLLASCRILDSPNQHRPY